MSKKIAIVMMNLGGPDSKDAIQPFLMNFFMDKNIIRLPLIFRFALATLISKKRSKREAGQSYGEIGGKSPLLENTQKQAAALETALNKTAKNIQFKTFIAMRYWHPMSDQTAREVRDWAADEIILLPLYPQFSTTTTWSSLGVWLKSMQALKMDRKVHTIFDYPINKGFIQASVDNIRAQYKRALKDGHKNPRVLFSAHGLPESIIKSGDPYQQQCEQTAQAIIKELAIKDLDYQYCYQSRVGPKKWIGPSLDEALEKAAIDQKSVIIYPHSFTQEHVETLVELDIEYKEMADALGIKDYYRAQTVATHPEFINGLAELVKAQLKQEAAHPKDLKSTYANQLASYQKGSA